jgi:hypothetical protein
MPSVHRILIADPIHEQAQNLLLSRPGFEVAVATGLNEAELAERIGGYDGIIVRSKTLHFDAAGAYQGFDSSSQLCCSDGKATICRTIAATHGNVAMVGDGVTDLAARAGGAYVVGFGGVIHRDIMLQEADCYIAAPSLIATLPALLTKEEQDEP